DSYGIQIQYNENVFSIDKTENVFQIASTSGVYKTKSAVIAIGVLGRPNRPSYSIPSELKKNVTFDITSTPIFDKNVLVVGGGDSASEYVQYLVQQRNKVTLSYRRDSFSRMLDHNLNAIEDLVNKKRIEIFYNSNIKCIQNNDGPQAVFEESSLGVKNYDHIVLALGGTTPKNFLQLLGIEFRDNWPVLDQNHQTNIKGLYLAGDLVQGPKGGSIITAFNSAFKVIDHLKKNTFKNNLKEDQYWQDMFF
ncbi:MAG: NAD(P)-binding domain-containing protein, partial [Bdellovibrionales bacterium]|nr:NAD(P)-binding domain-containing protein [Bdellovibrionales bacterium]